MKLTKARHISAHRTQRRRLIVQRGVGQAHTTTLPDNFQLALLGDQINIALHRDRIARRAQQPKHIASGGGVWDGGGIFIIIAQARLAIAGEPEPGPEPQPIAATGTARQHSERREPDKRARGRAPEEPEQRDRLDGLEQLHGA
jgi:hypothetical protein